MPMTVDPSTYTVPADQALLFSVIEGSETLYKSKSTGGTVSNINVHILNALGVATSDLPCLVYAADLNKCMNENYVSVGTMTVALASKASTQYVKQVAAAKLNKSTYLSDITLYPKRTEMDAALSLKANSTDVATALSTKANTADVYTRDQTVNLLDSFIGAHTVENYAALQALDSGIYRFVWVLDPSEDPTNPTTTPALYKWEPAEGNVAAHYEQLTVATSGAFAGSIRQVLDIIGDDFTSSNTISTVVAGKADAVHSHEIAGVTGLQTALDGKVSVSTGKSLIDDAEAAKLADYPAYSVVTAAIASAAPDGTLTRISTLESSVASISGNLSGVFKWRGTVDAYDDLADLDDAEKVSGYVYQIGEKEYCYNSRTSKWEELGFVTDVSSQLALKVDAVQGKSLISNDEITKLAAYPYYSELSATVNGKAAADHNHAISDVTGLQTALDGKVNVAENKSLISNSEITKLADYPEYSVIEAAIANAVPNGLTTRLGALEVGATTMSTDIEGKADADHTHEISDIILLQSTLDGLVTSTSLETTLADYATTASVTSAINTAIAGIDVSGLSAAEHTHTVDDITDLDLSGYASSNHSHEEYVAVDGSSVLTGDLVLRKNASAMDLQHFSVMAVVTDLDNDTPENGKVGFKFTFGIVEKTSYLKVDGSDILTKDLADTYYAELGHTHSASDITDLDLSSFDLSGYATADHTHSGYASSDHTHSDYAAASHSHAISDIADLQDALDDKATHTALNTVSSRLNSLETTGGNVLDVTCKQLGGLDVTHGLNNITGGMPLEVQSVQQKRARSYAFKNGSTIYYCSSATPATGTKMYTNNLLTTGGVNPSAVVTTGTKSATINSVVYTRSEADDYYGYNVVRVSPIGAQFHNFDRYQSIYYKPNGYVYAFKSSGNVILYASTDSPTTSTTMYFSSALSGTGIRPSSVTSKVPTIKITDAIVDLVPGTSVDDTVVFNRSAADDTVRTTTETKIIDGDNLRKGAYAFVSNQAKNVLISYAWKNATSGVVYYTNTTSPSTSSSFYIGYGLNGTAVKPTAASTAAVTLNGVEYARTSALDRFTNGRIVNCTKDIADLITTCVGNSAYYLYVYYLDAPIVSANWNAEAQNWQVGTAMYTISYSQFINSYGGKNADGNMNLYYQRDDNAAYDLIANMPSCSSSSGRPTEQQKIFDVYKKTSSGYVLIIAKEDLEDSTFNPIKMFLKDKDDNLTEVDSIAEGVTPYTSGDDVLYYDLVDEDGNVLISKNDFSEGILKKEGTVYNPVTKYDCCEEFNLGLFDSEEIWVHPNMNATFGLANQHYTFDKANVIPIYENTYGTGTELNLEAAVILMQDFIDSSNDSTLSYTAGSITDPCLAVIESPKRGYTSFADGENNAAIGYNAFVTGNSNEVYGDWSTTGGLCNVVIGSQSVAYGSGNIVTADIAAAFGGSNKVGGQYNTVVGVSNFTHGHDGMTIGSRNSTFGVNNLAVGFSNEMYSNRSIAVGTRNKSYDKANDSFLVGNSLEGYAEKSFVMGQNGVVNRMEGVTPGENTTVLQVMPIYGIPVKLTPKALDTYTGKTMYLSNGAVESGTYTSTKITSSHLNRWVIDPDLADTEGVSNKNGFFICMGNGSKDNAEAMTVMQYTKYVWSANPAYFDSSLVGSTNRSNKDPYILTPFHQWKFTGVMSMEYTEPTGDGDEVEVRDGGRVKTCDPGKNMDAPEGDVTSYILDFNTASRWNIPRGSGDVVLVPRNWPEGAEGYVVISSLPAGSSVSWSKFGPNEDDADVNHFVSGIHWVGTEPADFTGGTGGFIVVKIMVFNNVPVAQKLVDTISHYI